MLGLVLGSRNANLIESGDSNINETQSSCLKILLSSR